MKTGRIIDHLVYAVTDLATAIKDFETLTGVRPVFGGYHTTQGTKNALVRLGETAYLEFLAIDEANTEIPAPRWMGIDLIQKSQITRWALKSLDLEKDSDSLKAYPAEMGKIEGGQRKMSNGTLLKWELTMPLAMPKVEIIPFMIHWKNANTHPSTQLPQQCELLQLDLIHPNPTILQNTLNQLGVTLNITQGATSKIVAKIKCPKGIVEI